MQGVLDDALIQPDHGRVSYGGFWIRFGALFIDGILLAPITIGVMLYNISTWKSIPLLIISSIVGMTYKPLMEFMYGATVGKMVMKLKVTTTNFQNPDLVAVLLRNIFPIVTGVLGLFVYIMIYSDDRFQDITGFMEFSLFSQEFQSLQFVNLSSGLITIIDAIMLATDPEKRSLHDRIAKTYVIER